jgi:hypothetical protein
MEEYMADKIATYAFTDKESYAAAKERIRSELGDRSWDKGTTSDYWLLHILSDCDDPGRAAKICAGNGGKPY